MVTLSSNKNTVLEKRAGCLPQLPYNLLSDISYMHMNEFLLHFYI
jgi:hypothetical protein